MSACFYKVFTAIKKSIFYHFDINIGIIIGSGKLVDIILKQSCFIKVFKACISHKKKGIWSGQWFNFCSQFFFGKQQGAVALHIGALNTFWLFIKGRFKSLLQNLEWGEKNLPNYVLTVFWVFLVQWIFNFCFQLSILQRWNYFKVEMKQNISTDYRSSI